VFLPRLIFETADDDDPGAFLDGRGDVLGEFPPGGHVEELGVAVFPFAGLVLGSFVVDDAERGDCGTGSGVAEFWISYCVADDGHGGCHGVPFGQKSRVARAARMRMEIGGASWSVRVRGAGVR